jgi:hypothetical protein
VVEHLPSKIRALGSVPSTGKKVELTSYPAIPLLGIYPKELKEYVHTFIITVLFMIVNRWKPQVSMTDEWVNKICYIYTVEYHSVLTRKESLPFSMT